MRCAPPSAVLVLKSGGESRDGAFCAEIQKAMPLRSAESKGCEPEVSAAGSCPAGACRLPRAVSLCSSGAVRGLPDGGRQCPVRGRILGLPRGPFHGGSCSEASAGAARAQTSGAARSLTPSRLRVLLRLHGLPVFCWQFSAALKLH